MERGQTKEAIVLFIPYFRLLVFGILVISIVWSFFHFFRLAHGCILLNSLSVISSKFIHKFPQKCQYFTLMDQCVPPDDYYITCILREESALCPSCFTKVKQRWRNIFVCSLPCHQKWPKTKNGINEANIYISVSCNSARLEHDFTKHHRDRVKLESW